MHHVSKVLFHLLPSSSADLPFRKASTICNIRQCGSAPLVVTLNAGVRQALVLLLDIHAGVIDHVTPSAMNLLTPPSWASDTPKRALVNPFSPYVFVKLTLRDF